MGKKGTVAISTHGGQEERQLGYSCEPSQPLDPGYACIAHASRNPRLDPLDEGYENESRDADAVFDATAKSKEADVSGNIRACSSVQQKLRDERGERW